MHSILLGILNHIQACSPYTLNTIKIFWKLLMKKSRMHNLNKHVYTLNHSWTYTNSSSIATCPNNKGYRKSNISGVFKIHTKKEWHQSIEWVWYLTRSLNNSWILVNFFLLIAPHSCDNQQFNTEKNEDCKFKSPSEVDIKPRDTIILNLREHWKTFSDDVMIEKLIL